MERGLGNLKSRARRIVRSYLGEDCGSTTVEFVLWVPIFILILGLVIDVCFLFLAQSLMIDVASDSARRYALNIDTEGQCEANAQSGATFKGTQPTTDCIPNSPSAGVVTVEITHMAQDIDVVGILPFIASSEITIRVRQLVEGS